MDYRLLSLARQFILIFYFSVNPGAGLTEISIYLHYHNNSLMLPIIILKSY